ncbi:PDZ domain-containing protein [Candidatus Dependentiae bacterium]|nr:PDZ domain-containing protein [Candidatus Dependentiae bacterium]
MKSLMVKYVLLTLLGLGTSLQLHGRFDKSFRSDTVRKKPLSWAEICKERKSAIVQIIACRNHFDIFEPFRPPEQSGAAGSGSFISSDGYILTNFHVIEGAVGIYAQTSLTGKERFELELIGGCPQRDVALLRLTPKSLDRFRKISKQKDTPFVPTGNSDEIVEAQPIMSLGHPGGEEEVKITIGYVKGRTVAPGGALIQTTAPVNPGDSGGPFFDDKGNVIGLCVAKKVDSECFGYIIPMNNITLMFDDLVKNKILRLPFWGICFIPTSKSTRDYLQCPEEGVYISEVFPGALGEKAGFKRGDIITAVDDRKLDESGYLFVDWTDEKVSIVDYLNRLPIGSQVKASYCRDGKMQSALIKNDTQPLMRVDFFYPCFEQLPEYEIFAGMCVSQLTLNHIIMLNQMGVGIEPALAKYAQEEGDLEPRLLITSIFNTSKLHLSRAFNRRVTLLNKINGQRVTTIDEFRKAVLAGKNREFFTLESESGAFVALPLEEILEEEDRLSNLFCYKKSDLVVLLKK